MNNKERFIWISIIILALTYINRKQYYIDNLESLNKTSQLSYQIQSDQISEMLSSYNTLASSEYKKGFEDGKTHALITVMHEEEINSYADGYHAAISQLESEGLSKDMIKKVVKNLEID
jgi:hypothetical protein